MEDWGKSFINQYTKEERASLESLVDEMFQQNMLISLSQNLLAEICEIWWMVIGCFGNTASFDFIVNDQEFAKKVCQQANIKYDVFAHAINELVSNNVADLARDPEELERYTFFLFFNLVEIFTSLTGASTDELAFTKQPNLELLQRFYTKSAEIMDKGSSTWRNQLKTIYDGFMEENKEHFKQQEKIIEEKVKHLQNPWA